MTINLMEGKDYKNMEQQDRDRLIEHEVKILQLQTAVLDIALIKNAVVRIETQINNTNFTAHESRLNAIEKVLEERGVIIDDLKSFKIKVMVWGSIGVVLFHLVIAPFIMEKIGENKNTAATKTHP